ncbi:hypothetical protein [Actinophytocola oryzae]|uniref:Uncharacterized protein n=1 Tax=Actinophytocola oryzae TaxID=502181 RepID=A0A4R7UTN4_9PSEU|nr:hypothetical protein [Actinophytocola oryzae]TDV39999.1 hypothetical protein CLV71_12416 [Actinophytocola oryzae]
MTYPPQGPYGQQPDPYGQQQPQQPQYGGGYQQPQQPQQPQYGAGYQQQPPYGGYDPNVQYGGGYNQYGGFGGGPQPPKKNKGPIIAIVSIVVLVLAGVGITGFVAPGFFLSDDKGDSNTAGPGTSDKEKSSGADAFINKLVAAADDKDRSTLEGYQCSNATESVKGATKDIDEIDSAELKDTREKSDDEVVATLNIVVDGDDGDYDATVVKDGGDWCWKDITSGPADSGSSSTEETSSSAPAPGGGATGDSDGEKFVQSFLDKLNAGDGAGAAALSCSDSTSQGDITQAATQSPKLEMDPAGTTADSSYVGADLKGTLNGATASGRTSAFVEDGKWCIYTFFAS